ncbi:MAG: DUF370 domain-containing protein [Oscillospiraceae bacterium]|nr:DUF370 domain-containing protein [Oscillospiraceae bacterium]
MSPSYLYLGNDITVHTDNLIGIFDIERVTVNRDVNEYLRVEQKSGRIYYVSLDLPKSFAVTDERVYITNVSVATLKKRKNRIA